MIGLGAVGSATCLALARCGVSVVGIDAHHPPHSLGSTHGDSRITRQATFEGEAYVPLAVRSLDLWRQIEEEAAVDLLHACGGVRIAPAEATVAPDGTPDTFTRTVMAAQNHGIEHELLDADALRERFPQFRLDEPVRAYYEPGAGYLRPEATVAAQLDLAERAGAALHYDETVTGISSSASGVSLQTTQGNYSAAQVVLAAGPWTAGLIGDHASLACSRCAARCSTGSPSMANRRTFSPAAFRCPAGESARRWTAASMAFPSSAMCRR